MSRLEVLCATMHQTDFAKVAEMNIQSDAVFANQADCNGYDETVVDGHTVKMVTTDLRGVGKNRNTALLHATGEICLFADDDVTYADGYAQTVLKAFEELPDADVIAFNLDLSAGDENRRPQVYSGIKKIHKWSRISWGTCRVAFRLNAVKQKNLWFHTLFGGGCPYLSGEDSLWLLGARRAGLRLYAYPAFIGSVNLEQSSWYKGHDQRYYYSRGAFEQQNSPFIKYLRIPYYALRTHSRTQLGFFERLRWMFKGAKGYRKLLSFEEFTAQAER